MYVCELFFIYTLPKTQVSITLLTNENTCIQSPSRLKHSIYQYPFRKSNSRPFSFVSQPILVFQTFWEPDPRRFPSFEKPHNLWMRTGFFRFVSSCIYGIFLYVCKVCMGGIATHNHTPQSHSLSQPGALIDTLQFFD